MGCAWRLRGLGLSAARDVAALLLLVVTSKGRCGRRFRLCRFLAGFRAKSLGVVRFQGLLTQIRERIEQLEPPKQAP